jgi:hypothetical protein
MSLSSFMQQVDPRLSFASVDELGLSKSLLISDALLCRRRFSSSACDSTEYPPVHLIYQSISMDHFIFKGPLM